MKGKGYGCIVWFDDEASCIRRRKLTSAERAEVLTNYIRRRSGRKFVVQRLSEIFGVSERTIQKHLADLEAKGWIERKACFDKSGKQNGNVIVYTGDKKRLTGDELTLEKIMGFEVED